VKKLSGLFCAVLCAKIVHSAMHTHMNRLTVVCWLDLAFCGYIVCYSLSVLHVDFCDYFEL